MPETLTGRILIVDDRADSRYVLTRILQSEGYKCEQADGGMQALEIAQTNPDLIILDVRLPDISGIDVCRRLKAESATSSIMVLQMSASFVSNDARVEALDAGADAYMTHPIDRTVLMATVRALLRLRNAEWISRRSSEQWQSTFDSLSEGVALVDEHGCVAKWNGAFREICGCKAHLDSGEDAALLLERLIGPSDLLRQSAKRASGDFNIGKRAVQVSVARVEGNTARGEKVLILTDTTDRKLAEHALRTAEKLSATGRLASTIAHEINNPLEALINLIYLARASESIDTAHTLLDEAGKELDRISRITKQALSFYRDPHEPMEIDLGELLAEVAGIIGRAAIARRVSVVLERRSTEKIYGFPGQLAQVFTNIVRNATEASPSGSEVVVRLSSVERAGRRGNRITIHDRGTGVPEEIRGNLFDPFFSTKELRGSGLGLWVSKSLVERHHGTIRFRSSEHSGKSGTTFEVFLPVIEYTRRNSSHQI
jgi:two-component system, NtrC family, sensor kinase